MKKYCFLLHLFIACLSSAVFAADIAVTKISVVHSKTGKSNISTAKITLNGSVEISGIRVFNGGKQTVIKFPEYTSRNGKKYPQVVLITKQAEDAVRQAIESGLPVQAFKRIQAFGITKFTRYNGNSKLKAFAVVRLNYAVDIQCKIFEGRTGAWVAWPEIKAPGKKQWNKVVRVVNSRLKNEIEAALIEKYRNSAAESGAPVE